MRAIIIASSRSDDDTGWQQWVQNGDLIIGADGGAARALAWGLVPHLVIGDMDSLSSEDRQALAERGCRFIEHPRAKDETDLELALNYASERGASSLGMRGGKVSIPGGAMR